MGSLSYSLGKENSNYMRQDSVVVDAILPVLDSTSAVSTYTEWDSLKEVVVGRISGAVFPTWQDTMKSTMPEESWKLFQEKGGRPFPEDQVEAAARELDNFSDILQAEGIKVVRPDDLSYNVGFSTPN